MEKNIYIYIYVLKTHIKFIKKIYNLQKNLLRLFILTIVTHTFSGEKNLNFLL